MKKQNLKQDRPLSYSSLKAFSQSPNHLVAYWDKDFKPTPAMIKGSLLHCLILEPEEFDKRYYVFDDSEKCQELIEGGAKSPRATADYKEWKAEKMKTFEGKEEVKVEDLEELQPIADHVRKNILLKKMTGAELAIDWDFNGVPFKGFVDGYGDGFIFDVKTTSDASPKAFARDVVKFRYYWQASLYRHANRVLDFAGDLPDYFIIAVETSAPFNVQIYKMSPAFIDKGFAEVSEMVDKFKKWDGTPQGYDYFNPLSDDGVIDLNLPQWL